MGYPQGTAAPLWVCPGLEDCCKGDDGLVLAEPDATPTPRQALVSWACLVPGCLPTEDPVRGANPHSFEALFLPPFRHPARLRLLWSPQASLQ